MKNKNMFFVIMAISIAFFAIEVSASPVPVVEFITGSDISAIDPADFSWNAQHFPGSLSYGDDEQFSVGGGLNGSTGFYGDSDWIEDPGTNTFTVEISGSNFLTASLNGIYIHPGFEYGIEIPYGSVLLWFDDNRSNFPGDYFEITNLEIDGETLPDLYNSGSSNLVGIKISYDGISSIQGPLLISGNFNWSQVQNPGGKEIVIHTSGTTIPEPGSIALLFLGFLTVLSVKKISMK